MVSGTHFVEDVSIHAQRPQVEPELEVLGRQTARAEGDEEARKVRSDADKQVRIITADARQKADVVRGEGDAQAVKIFADAYGRDPDFYEFVRTMDAYRKTIDVDTTLILSTDSDFFRWLSKPTRSTPPGG